MNQPAFTDAELAAYLDEALPVEQMSNVESALAEQPEMLQRLQQINRRRDMGVHTLGEIWRRHRISCPTRAELGSYLLGVASAEAKDFVDRHIETVGCRICQANLEDLREEQQAQPSTEAQSRRRRYFQSSAGHLKTDA